MLHVLIEAAREAVADLLFVYGSLRRDGEEHNQMRGSKFLGSVKTARGWKRVRIGDFDGLRDGGDGQVAGELYRVDQTKLAALDDWEYDLYHRVKIPLEDGRDAFAYVLR